MDSEQSRTLYCGNLSEKVTEEILYELFLQAGPIDEVRIPKSRSFGFVTYRHEATIPYALNLYSGTRLFGREITIALKTQQGSAPPDRDHPGKSILSHGPRGMTNSMPGHMTPQMRVPPPPPPLNVPTISGLSIDIQGLLQMGQHLNANLQGGFNASSRGNYYGDNRTNNDLVNRGKHYRSHESRKPYENNRRQRDIDKDRERDNNRGHYRDRDRRHRR
ncbi:RNA-binding protein 7 [Lutzomyia longipalpis]|uniref:RNA-binding protein 7 n=1 Tax=Lutzomyia longipalpis TaxID=7200 RepID=UPI0024842EE9|nr:RNA-binding protein 7 [Lutzomyia longipalpis]